MSATLAELAARFDCELKGEPDTVIDSVGTLATARDGAISFLANPRYRDQLAMTLASAVIVAPADVDHCPVAALVCDNPYATYARVASLLHPAIPAEPGVHSSAAVAGDAQISPLAQVGACAVVGAGCVVGEATLIGPCCVLGDGVRVGAGTRLTANVSVMDGVVIGRRCTLHSGAVIGADGFGFAPDQGEWIKIPQLGGVVIGDDVEIGANSCVDRGAIDDTVLEDGVKLDNLVQVGHNARLGAHSVMAGASGVAGSTTIGKRCAIGPVVSIVGHLTICDDVTVTFASIVMKSITKPGTYSGALAAEQAMHWRRIAGRFRNLDALAKRLADMERRLAILETHTKDTRTDD